MNAIPEIDQQFDYYGFRVDKHQYSTGDQPNLSAMCDENGDPMYDEDGNPVQLNGVSTLLLQSNNNQEQVINILKKHYGLGSWGGHYLTLIGANSMEWGEDEIGCVSEAILVDGEVLSVQIQNDDA